MQRKPQYLEDWKEKQTQASEEMVKELFLKLLPGAEAHVSNYYPVRNSLKQTNENDIMRKRDKYVWAAIFNLTWYCIVSLVLTSNDKIVPDSLTVAWFAAWTAELALLANIKIKGTDD